MHAVTDTASEPTLELERDGVRYTLLGTAHVSQASVRAVRELVGSGAYDAVAVELCPSRYQAVVAPDAMASLDLFRVIREGKVPMVAASLALGAFQQRLAEQLGVDPGAEMRAAVEAAGERGLPVLLIDREIGVTLRRIYRNVPWWERFGLAAGLLAGLWSSERVAEEDIERLKAGDVLEVALAELGGRSGALAVPLIDERDRYMAARLRAEQQGKRGARVLAVVGAGHLAGLGRYLREDEGAPAEIVAALETVPPPSPWPRRIAWGVVAVILAGFAIGFTRSPDLGLQLLFHWVVINGGLSALGAAIAGAHPLAVATAFGAAPITSLNPTIGAGMVTAAVEVWLRRPTVGDFARLRTDTAHLAGWRHNRVARALAVFVLSSLGSAVGTWVAGFVILDRLLA